MTPSISFCRMKAAQQMQASGQKPSPAQIAAVQKSMPPELLRKLRAAGPAGAQKVMQEAMAGGAGGSGLDMNAMMQAMGGAGGLGEMMKNMPGMGGLGGMGGGMPGTSILQRSPLPDRLPCCLLD